MNIRFYRSVDRFLGPPTCAVLSLLNRFRNSKPSAAAPRKILVILLSEMGSLVLAQPMFAQLKRKYPDASIHLLMFARNLEAVGLLGVVPTENVITFDGRSVSSLLVGAFRALAALRSLRADVCIDCELFARVSTILSYLSGAPIRVGFDRFTQEGLYRGSLVNRPVLYNPYRHISSQFLTLAAAIDSSTCPSAKLLPAEIPESKDTNPLPAPEIRDRIEKLHADFPSIRGKSLVLVYASGGILPIRAWPLAHFQELCKELLQDGHAVGLIGMREDVALGESIVSACQSPYCVNLCGYTDSMRHLLALFDRASLLIANDGAPGQFAAITSLPTILLFGPETPLLYAPLAANVHSMHLAFSCSPCLTAYNHRNSPCDGDNQCLKQISPAQVLDKARELLVSSVLVASSSSFR